MYLKMSDGSVSSPSDIYIQTISDKILLRLQRMHLDSP